MTSLANCVTSLADCVTSLADCVTSLEHQHYSIDTSISQLICSAVNASSEFMYINLKGAVSQFFSCPSQNLEERDSCIGGLVTKYYTLLKNTTIKHSERLVTLDTCNQSDEET